MVVTAHAGPATMRESRLRREVMLVEPDAARRAALAAEWLRHEAFSLTGLADPQMAWEWVRQDRFDAIVIAAELAEPTAETVCRQLREMRVTGAPVVLADRPDDALTIRLLEAGALDCIARQTRPAVILARLRAHMRWRDLLSDAFVWAGPLVLETPRKRLRHSETDRRATLTRTEMALFRALARAGGRPLPLPALYQAGWGRGTAVHSRTVQTHLYRLRQKLRAVAGGDADLRRHDQGYALGLACGTETGIPTGSLARQGDPAPAPGMP